MDESLLVKNYPEYPADWIELTEECRQDYLLPTIMETIMRKVSKKSTWTAYPSPHDHHAATVPTRNSLQGS